MRVIIHLNYFSTSRKTLSKNALNAGNLRHKGDRRRSAVIFKGSGFYQTDYRSEEYKTKAKKETESAKPEAGNEDGIKARSQNQRMRFYVAIFIERINIEYRTRNIECRSG